MARCSPRHEIETFVVQTLEHEQFRRLQGAADGEKLDRIQVFFRRWPTLPQQSQWKALPHVLQEVVFDPQDSTITVSLDAAAVKEFLDVPPAGD